VSSQSSAIGWIDFSSEHREKVKTVIDLLGSPGVLDELGVGAIRDSFSDALFPGLSTIQTRAKYFLTIPRILRDYERLAVAERRSLPLRDYLRNRENRVMACLAQNHREERDPGIIGIRFAGKRGEVQRKPSSVYWNGLRTFGLVGTSLSLREFTEKFANPKVALHDLITGTDTEKGDDPDAVEREGPAVHTAAYPDGWEDGLTLRLSFDEATFLARQIEARVPDSLLGQILMDDGLRSDFVQLPNGWGFTDFCDRSGIAQRLSTPLRSIVWAARDFWQLLHGAHLRYNVLLQQYHGTAERGEQFVQRWVAWCTAMERFLWDRWDTSLVWNLADRHRHQIKPFTVTFVEQWIAAVRSDPADTPALDLLVINQERRNKRARARLRPDADERVTQWAGLETLEYRYPQARRIIDDIHLGLTDRELEHA